MNEIEISVVREYYINKKDIWSQHAVTRCKQRGIKVADVGNAIMTGEIIEQYPDDYPYPSCLILGKGASEKMIHIVCGIGNGYLWAITAYCPDSDKWKNDFKTRKDETK